MLVGRLDPDRVLFYKKALYQVIKQVVCTFLVLIYFGRTQLIHVIKTTLHYQRLLIQRCAQF